MLNLIAYNGLALSVIYFGALIFLIPSNGNGDHLYVAFVTGALPLFGLGLVSIVSMRKTLLPTLLMYLFAILTICFALARGDTSTALNIALMAGVIIAIANFRLTMSLGAINWLFVAAIALGGLTTMTGSNFFGLIPFVGAESSLAWRVSIFPKVPDTAFLSSIVLIVNLNQQGGKKWAVYLSAFFLVFSGLRSVLMLTGASLLYIYLRKRGYLRRKVSVTLYIIASISGTLLFLLYGQLLLYQLSQALPGGLQGFLFRSGGESVTIESIRETVYRVWLWQEHIRLVGSDWLLGMGTFDFNEVAHFPPGYSSGNGSESYWTGLFARVGVFSILPLVAFIGWASRHRNSDTPAAIAILLIGLGFTYGSFYAPYSMNFILMVALIINGVKIQNPPRLTLSNGTNMNLSHRVHPRDFDGERRA